MRRFLYVFAALWLVVGLYHGADAAWNIMQKSDGTAQWRATKADTAGADINHPIGSVYLNVLVSDLATLSTGAVVSPITRAQITSIRSVLMQDITSADAVFAMWVSTDLDGTVSSEVTNTTSRMTITAGNGTGDETGDVDTFTPTGNNKIERNQVLFIQSLGGTTTVSAISTGVWFTITLERY